MLYLLLGRAEAQGLNPRAVAVMAHNGVDISAHTSDVLTDEMLAAADLLCRCAPCGYQLPLAASRDRKASLAFYRSGRSNGTEADISACFQSVCGEIRDAMVDLIHELSANRQMSVRQDSDERCFNKVTWRSRASLPSTKAF